MSGGAMTCPGCGAKIAPPAGGGVTKCEYCGTTLQVPAGPSAVFPPPMHVPPESPGYGAPPGYGAGQVPRFQVPQLVPKKRRSRAKIAIIVVVALAAASGLAYFIWYMAWSRVEGRVESTGGVLGTWSASFDECRSGDAFHPSWFGVDLRAGSPSAHVQVQGGDARAKVVVSGAAGDEPYVNLTKAGCATFDVLVESGSAEVNDVDAVQGRVHVDCTAADGGRIRIDAEFKACH
ncbi:MAG: hypothetical protein HY905_20720 [Deltaproteobacteria bacterium]|nr:hypothetical protein [Deltaproteobacteria bacterium]